MTGLIILILLIVGVPYLWRWLKPYLMRWVQHRTEDYVRSKMGMPPRDRSRGSRRNDSGRQQQRTRGGNSRGYSRSQYSDEPLIPKEYAEDVDFTEMHSYSDDTEIASDGKNVKIRQESQVSDAEIIEIRKD